MSVTRPLGRVLQPFRRTLTTTPALHMHKRPPPPPVTHSADSAPYTPADIAALRKHYSPAQITSFLAGETSISRSDFDRRVRRSEADPMLLRYLDDLSTIDPTLDFPSHHSPPEYVAGHPLQPLPVMEDPFQGGDEAAVPWIRDVSRRIGFSESEVAKFRTKILVTHRVVNQTHMGKIQKIYSLAVAGNGNGLVGIGEGKAVEHDDSQRMATYMAVRNLEPVPRYENRTIYGDVEVKLGAVELGLYSRPPGFGVRCSQYVFEIARCAGIHDLSARATRSRNPMNVIKATMHALRSQKLPETIARGRGKKFVDVRKVYYNGMV
ncbi:uncharacterized protein H6S33_004081 [Morchella sextelata]|uniref:uncharacterized protein n=1 Tax=Morchella sextelata TaxID=1174677 RepID=UPI001D057EB3|nr:uncharacterized protein H6S33_004081 [Morchella sextelata]KAH0606420.1 hypothetical protein H6S33_004081 [Morchella sextelata]